MSAKTPTPMCGSFNEQAAFLIKDALACVEQVMIKHSAAVLEEMFSQIVKRNTRISELEAELVEARRDVARYRYLRDSRSALAIALFHRREPEEWDSEIDAAIAATKGESHDPKI